MNKTLISTPIKTSIAATLSYGKFIKESQKEELKGKL